MTTTSIYRALAGAGEWPAIGHEDALRLREDDMDLVAAGVLEWGDAAAWPVVERALLARRCLDAAARELVEADVLGQTLRVLADAKVACLILKGAAVARTHYAVSWTRIRGDIDLLVPHPQRTRAELALRAADWRPTVEPRDPIVSGQRHFSHRVAAAPPLDLHVRLFAPALPRAPSFAEVWERRRDVPGLVEGACTVSDADALWYGCVHIALHHTGKASVPWLFDLDRIARGLDRSGWAAVRSRARTTATRAVCGGVLSRAADLFGTPLPRDISDWETAEGESANRFMAARSELQIQWMNLQALGGWRARSEFLRAHVLPDADYMRERYRVTSGVGLAAAYAHRAVAGALKWAALAMVGKR